MLGYSLPRCAFGHTLPISQVTSVEAAALQPCTRTVIQQPAASRRRGRRQWHCAHGEDIDTRRHWPIHAMNQSSAIIDGDSSLHADQQGFNNQQPSQQDQLPTQPAIPISQDTIENQAEAIAAVLGVQPHMVRRMLAKHSTASIPIPQLVSYASGLRDTLQVNPMSALKMLLKKPDLTKQPLNQVLSKVTTIAALAGLDIPRAGVFLARQPFLIEIPLPVLQQGLSQLASGLSPPTVARALLVLSRSNSSLAQQLLSCNSSDVRHQLSELEAVMVLHFGHGKAGVAHVLVKEAPQLLLTAPGDVSDIIATLFKLLRLSRGKACSLVCKCPTLLTLSAKALENNFRGMLGVLRINPAAIAAMCTAEPCLLRLEPSLVRDRVDGLMAGMYLPREQVLDMLVRQPQLLLYQPATLTAHMSGLMAALSVQHEVVVAILQRHPTLLLWTTSTIKAKLSLLSQLFDLTPLHARELATSRPVLLTFSAQRLTDSRQVVTQLLGFGTRHLSATVRQWPSLIVLPPGTIQGKVRDMAALMACSEDTEGAGRLIRANPVFVTQDLRLWQTNYDSLTSQLGLSGEQARAAIHLHPKLLSTEPRNNLQLCRTLYHLVCSHPTWRDAWHTASASDIVRVMTAKPQALQQLAFLVDQGLQQQNPLLNPDLLDTTTFPMRFKSFSAWQAAQALLLKATTSAGFSGSFSSSGGGVGARSGRAAGNRRSVSPSAQETASQQRYSTNGAMWSKSSGIQSSAVYVNGTSSAQIIRRSDDRLLVSMGQ